MPPTAHRGEEPIRLLAVSDWADTGFGRVMRELLPRLAATGLFEIEMVAWVHDGDPDEYDAARELGIRLHHCIGDPWGQRTLRRVAARFRPRVVLSLGDPWMVEWIAGVESRRAFRWVAYVPIDRDPIAHSWLSMLSEPDVLVLYSDFGADVVRRQLPFRHPEMIYHGVDTETFRPLGAGERAAARASLMRVGLEDFVVGMVCRNQERKNVPAAFAAFKAFNCLCSADSSRVPDSPPVPPASYDCPRCGRFSQLPDRAGSRLYLHMTMGTDPDDGRGISWNIHELVERYRLKGRVQATRDYSVRRGVSSAELNHIYNLFDAHLITTKREGFCLLPTSRVQTAAGYEEIRHLQAGDRVITHAGRLRTVTELLTREVRDEPIRAISIPGRAAPLRVTREHPVLAVRREGRRHAALRASDLVPEWIAAGELTDGDLVFVPRRAWDEPLAQIDLGVFADVEGQHLTSRYTNRGGRPPTSADVAAAAGVSPRTARVALGKSSGYYESESVAVATIDKVHEAASDLGWKAIERPSRFLDLTEDVGYFFGQYAAEGSLGPNGQIEFASHRCETSIRERLAHVATEVWRLRPREFLRDGNKASLIACCAPLAEALAATCGRGAHNKRLPPFVFGNEDFARGFLRGLWDGDGHTPSMAGRRATYSTVSHQLAHGLIQLLSAHGVYGHMTWHRRANGFEGWCVHACGRDESRLRELLGVGPPDPGRRGSRAIRVSGGWLVPIQVRDHRYTGTLYNLEVEEDHSYCVEGVAVHNCLPVLEAMAAGVPNVVTAHSACRELVEKGGGELIDVMTFVLDPHDEAESAIVDPCSAAEALDKLFHQPARRQEISESGRAFAESLTWEATMPRWIALLHAAAGRDLPWHRRDTERLARVDAAPADSEAP